MALKRPRVAVGALLGISSLILYTITLAPDILAHDSGEWQAAAATLGISHPPGSPAYILLGYLFSLAPIGSLAARVSFLSAVMGSLGVLAVYCFMLTLFDRMLPALVSAATLAVAAQWWSHASVATPYNAVPTVIAIELTLLLLWRRSSDIRLIWTGALIYGLGLAYHPSLLFFLPVLIAGVFFLGPWRGLFKPKPALITILLFCAGLSLYAYLPVRSAMDPQIEYAKDVKIDSVSSFLNYVSASDTRDTGHGVFRMPGVGDLGDKLAEVVREGFFPSYAFLIFGPAIVLLYPAVWPALRRIRRELIFLAAAMVGHMFIVFAISGVYAQYYMPMLFYFSVWAGFSVWLIMSMSNAYLSEYRWKYIPVAVTGLIYFGVLVLGLPHAWDFANHKDDIAMREYAETVFRQAEYGATVLAGWESYTGLVYLQTVEGKRPDLELIPSPPEGWSNALPEVRARGRSQILVSRTLPFFREGQDLSEVSNAYYVSIKGRTYQDYAHGEPYPAKVQLFILNQDT